MNRLEHFAVLLTALLLVGIAWAGQNESGSELRLALDLTDGSHIIGVPSIKSVFVQTSYAKMDIPFSKVRRIEISADHKTALFEFRNGDKLKGTIDLGSFEIQTSFGKVKIGLEHIRQIKVLGISGISK